MSMDLDTLRDTLAALKYFEGNQTKTAEYLGIARSTLQERIKKAEAVLGGQQVQEITSTLYSYETEDGKKVLQWVKQLPPKAEKVEKWQQVVDYVAEVSKDITPFASGPLPKDNDDDLLTVYVLADHHLGMYAWKDEAGDDYDVDIGEKVLLNAMAQLTSHTPRSSTAVVLNVGDFFHSDSDENRTRRSGNALDVDTRYARVLKVGVKLLIRTVIMALEKHAYVIVKNLRGNHDPYGALALTAAVDAYFANDPRVTVDDNPAPIWFFRFGKVLLASTHGDMIKAQDMPGVVAAYRAKDWGETEWRYILLGHVHHKSVGGGEHHGAVWETFQTLAPKDAWHRASGYSSGRSMVAITYHRDRGEWFRHYASIGGPK